MDYKTGLIAIMSVIVVLLSGYLVGMTLLPKNDQSLTQISFANNSTSDLTYANTSPKPSITKPAPPSENNNSKKNDSPPTNDSSYTKTKPFN